MIRPALFLHILSLLILAGGMIGGTLMHATLEKTATASPASFVDFMRASIRFAMLAQLGALCMLLSGVFLLRSRGWGDWGHPWLTVKLTIFVLLVLNGIFVARPTAMKLASAYGRNSADPVISKLLKRLSVFHAVQLAGIAAIVSLAVFGP